MINKLFNELIVNSYQEKHNLRKTLLFITTFENLLEQYYRRQGKIYKIQGPIIFSEGNNQNENNYLINEPKSILFSIDNFLAELSVGNRKWARILATNMHLLQNEILIVLSNSYNLNRNIDTANPAWNNEIIVTVPVSLNDYDEKKFAFQVRKAYTALINIIEKTYVKCGIKSKKIGSEVIIFNLNEINYDDEISLEKEILAKINNYSECVGIYKVPKNYSKNYFFKYDVYDHNFFVRFYGCNKFTASIINLCEISLTVNNNIYQQCKTNYLNEYKESNYYASILDKKIANYLQIKFNLSQIYLFFLEKYTIQEVISAPLANKDSHWFRKKKIRIL